MAAEFIKGRVAHFHGDKTVTVRCTRCDSWLWLQEAEGHKTWRVVKCDWPLGDHVVEYDPAEENA